MENYSYKPKLDDLKQEKKLLYFGLDFLIINIMESRRGIGSKAMSFIDSIFNYPHNTTNTNHVGDFAWADTTKTVSIDYVDSKNGEAAQIHYREHFIFRIIRIDNQNWRRDLHYEYKYRIEFYGTFFNLVRMKEFSISDFMAIFMKDIQENMLKLSVGRSDICADMSCFTTKDIEQGIKGDPAHRKKITHFNINPSTNIPESFYYGKNSKTWFARAYDKKLDSIVKGKAGLYSDYFQYENATRLELEIHSCSEYGLSLANCLNNEFLWAVCRKLLDSKYVKWRICKFINQELIRSGFNKFDYTKLDKMPVTLPMRKYVKRLLTMAFNFEKRYGQDILEIFDRELPLMRNDSNHKKLKYSHNPLQ